MAIPFLNHLDLRSVSELQNAILHKTTSGSASDIEGKIIYDTGTDTIKYYSGTSGSGSWISLTGDTNTFRTVKVDTNNDGSANATLGATENLQLIGGTNITLAESAGVVTINAGASTTVGLTNSTQRSGSIELIAGTNVAISESGTTGHYTFSSTDTNTQNTTTLSFVDSSNDVILRNTTGGAGSGNQDIKMVAGSNITLTHTDANTMSIASTDTNTDTLQTIAAATDDDDKFVTFVETATGAQTGMSQANFKFNPNSGTLYVPNVVVSGTQTISNETVQVVENNTILFEGATADAHEIKLTVADPTADRVATIPDASGTVNLGYSTTVGGATTAEVTHNLNSRNVVVQLFDSSSFETVHADVVRTTVNTVDLTFASAPASGDITVLVTRVA